MTFSFDDNNAVKIHYECVPDRKTAINVTNHSYFNLEGFDKGQITEHVLQLFCDAYTPTDALCIPTGEIRPVKGTPFDFRLPKKIGRDLNHDDEQLKIGIGYDHNFCLDHRLGRMKHSASAWDPESGRSLDVYTGMPGIQLYTANSMHEEVTGKEGAHYKRWSGFALETQFYPDAINKGEWEQPVIFADEIKYFLTTYKFGVKD